MSSHGRPFGSAVLGAKLQASGAMCPQAGQRHRQRRPGHGTSAIALNCGTVFTELTSTAQAPRYVVATAVDITRGGRELLAAQDVCRSILRL